MVEQESKQGTKRRFSKAKIIGIIAFAVPVILGAFFIYEMSFRQVLIVQSESPGGEFILEVFEKGEPANDGPSTIILKSNSDKLEVGLRAKGDYLDESNVIVVWENESVATITLSGKGQEPSIIEFDNNATEKFNVKKDGFEISK